MTKISIKFAGNEKIMGLTVDDEPVEIGKAMSKGEIVYGNINRFGEKKVFRMVNTRNVEFIDIEM